MKAEEMTRDVYVFLMQGEYCKAHAPDSYNCGICRNHIVSALTLAQQEARAERDRDVLAAAEALTSAAKALARADATLALDGRITEAGAAQTASDNARSVAKRLRALLEGK